MKFSLLALAIAAVAPFSAQASELNYNYVEADYASSHLAGTTAGGYNFKGSMAFGDSFYGAFTYGQVSKNRIDSGLVNGTGSPILFDADLSNTTVSLGFRHAISDKADFYSELGYARSNLGLDVRGFGKGSESGNGYRIAAGVRGMLTDQFEGNFNVNYADVGNAGNGVGVGIGGIYHINDTWGITGNYDYATRGNVSFGGVAIDETIKTWSIGVRASF
jgi:hypothetical protein